MFWAFLKINKPLKYISKWLIFWTISLSYIQRNKWIKIKIFKNSFIINDVILYSLILSEKKKRFFFHWNIEILINTKSRRLIDSDKSERKKEKEKEERGIDSF